MTGEQSQTTSRRGSAQVARQRQQPECGLDENQHQQGGQVEARDGGDQTPRRAQDRFVQIGQHDRDGMTGARAYPTQDDIDEDADRVEPERKADEAEENQQWKRRQSAGRNAADAQQQPGEDAFQQDQYRHGGDVHAARCRDEARRRAYQRVGDLHDGLGEGVIEVRPHPLQEKSQQEGQKVEVAKRLDQVKE